MGNGKYIVEEFAPLFGDTPLAQITTWQAQTQDATVSPELKEAMGAFLMPNLEQNRNIFLVRRGRGLGLLNDFKQNLEAASGFEPLHRGFADLSLNHLGTPPSEDR